MSSGKVHIGNTTNERYGWYDDASPDHRPKFRVFTEKAMNLSH